MSITSQGSFRGAEFDRLTGGDALFLDVESGLTRMFVAVCLLFEAGPSNLENGRLDFERIRSRVGARLADIPRYRRRLSVSPLERRPIWLDDPEFDLDRHVRHRELPGHGAMHQLETLCADLAARDLDRDHPLWELWVIEGVEEGRFAVLMKAHHSMVDGIAGMQLLQSVLDVEPKDAELSEAHWAPNRVPHVIELAALELADRVRAMARLASDAWTAFGRPRELIDDAKMLAKGFRHAERFELHPASDSPLNHPVSADRRIGWWDVELTRIEEIRRAKGGTLNDVVVATLALALGRVLEERGFPAGELRDMDLRVTCPVNTRPRGRPSEAANQISLLVAPLPVGEDDPLVVLDRVRESLAVAKDSNMVVAVHSILRLADWMPRFVSRELVRYALKVRSANVVVTNIPGPPLPLFLLKSRLLAAYPIVPLMPGHSLCVAVLSYAGRLHWGLNADWQAVADLEDWSRAIEEAFERLHSASVGGVH